MFVSRGLKMVLVGYVASESSYNAARAYDCPRLALSTFPFHNVEGMSRTTVVSWCVCAGAINGPVLLWLEFVLARSV
jgi:hypothetical protein